MSASLYRSIFRRKSITGSSASAARWVISLIPRIKATISRPSLRHRRCFQQLADLGFIKEAQYQGTSQNGIGYNFHAGLDYNVNKNMTVGGKVGYDTFGNYNESTAGIWLRYMLGDK